MPFWSRDQKKACEIDPRYVKLVKKWVKDLVCDTHLRSWANCFQIEESFETVPSLLLVDGKGIAGNGHKCYKGF
jgi:hypothetical protein